MIYQQGSIWCFDSCVCSLCPETREAGTLAAGVETSRDVICSADLQLPSVTAGWLWTYHWNPIKPQFPTFKKCYAPHHVILEMNTDCCWDLRMVKWHLAHVSWYHYRINLLLFSEISCIPVRPQNNFVASVDLEQLIFLPLSPEFGDYRSPHPVLQSTGEST